MAVFSNYAENPFKKYMFITIFLLKSCSFSRTQLPDIKKNTKKYIYIFCSAGNRILRLSNTWQRWNDVRQEERRKENVNKTGEKRKKEQED